MVTKLPHTVLVAASQWLRALLTWRWMGIGIYMSWLKRLFTQAITHTYDCVLELVSY